MSHNRHCEADGACVFPPEDGQVMCRWHLLLHSADPVFFRANVTLQPEPDYSGMGGISRQARMVQQAREHALADRNTVAAHETIR